MNAIISGTYTVVSAKTGAHRTVAIMDDDFEWMTNYKPAAGTRVVKAMLGSDNERLTSIGTLSPAGELRIWKKHESRNDLVAALKYVIGKGAEERVQMGKTYAVMSKRCFICNHKLTNPASHFYGYGPDCAEHNGLPYNANVTQGEVASATEPVGDVLAQASAIVAQHDARPTCRLCGGNGGQLNGRDVHNLCEARAARGLDTPSLGDVCPTCNGSGVDPHKGLKQGQALYNPSGNALKAAFPDCPTCKGTRVVNAA